MTIEIALGHWAITTVVGRFVGVVVHQAEVVTKFVKADLQKSLQETIGVASAEPSSGDNGNVVAGIFTTEHEIKEIWTGSIDKICLRDSQNVSTELVLQGLRKQARIDFVDVGRIVVDNLEFVE